MAGLGKLTQEQLEEKLMEARRTYKLNLGYAGLKQIPAGFVDLVKKYNPHITELELSSNDLTDLPEELAELQFIRMLRIKYNQLKRIPAVITKLPQLMILEVSGNRIQKVDESIGQCTILKELDLSGNEIAHLPDALGMLPKLECLQLENNRLDVLPDNLGELPSLLKIDASTNNLRYLPASMGLLRKIQRIDAANNLLTRVPPSMGHLKTLKELNLRYNNLDERYRARVEEGLSKFLAFLREEEERERLEEIERLKPIGTPVGPYLEYRCKVDFGQVVKTEHGEITLDNRCWIRSGHTLTHTGSMLIVFGGQLVKDGSTTSDVFWMTLDRMEWHAQPCRGDRPCPRYNHTAVWDEEANRLIVFGGRTAERKRLNDVYVLDLETWTWHKPATEGTPPSPRELASSCFWAGNLVLFGGHAIGGRTNDLFLLDLSSCQWQQPATSGTAPSPRQAAALCIGHSNMLVVHGGRNNFVLEDLHVLDFVSKSWQEVAAEGRVPPPRHSHLISMWREQLFLFGGLDELGAQSFAMFRVALPLGENYAIAKPKWTEWDSELPYNKNRSATFFNGSIYIYQLGSNTLGRVNEEDAEKGLVYWDVFKTARLESLKPKQLAEEELRPKNAKRARVQHTGHIAGKMPRSYSCNSAQEARVLAYVQDFQRVFEELYPHRRPLYLTPRNECGVPKFVCTTLRPTALNYQELYDLEGTAQFVADYLAYEELEDPLHPPEHLPSPMSVLNWQAGDCFDASVVLASLLLGVGYNAYVVVGYAPEAVTTNDQTGTTCPVLERECARGAAAALLGNGTGASGGLLGGRASKAMAASAAATNEAHETTRGPKYVIKPLATLESKVVQAKQAALDTKPITLPTAAAATATAAAANGRASPAAGHHHKQGAICRTVHAWVLVMAGKRDLAEPVFIEPSTGRRYPLNASPYEGVEYIWNNTNFWVCMQQPAPHSDSRAHPASLSWDLSDVEKWEAVFEERAGRAHLEGGAGEDLLDLRSELGGKSMVGNMSIKTPMAAGTPGAFSMGGMAGTPKGLPGGGGGAGKGIGGGGASGGGAMGMPPRTPGGGITARLTARSRRGGDGASDGPPRTADGDSIAGDIGDGEGLGEADIVPDIPRSWVAKLSIPRDAFDMRCPRGSKLTLYYQSQHEIFALFGDCSRWDGMVERLQMYEDDERTVVSEIRETFNRRKDKLRERRVYPQKDTTIEQFDMGSSFGLKDILTVRGEKREFNFYTSARLDGLVRREELEGFKLIETFTGRDDRLVYRSATYAAVDGQLPSVSSQDVALPGEDEAARRARRARAAAGQDPSKKQLLPIYKMTEKFARNPAVDADKDVAKLVYYLAEGRIRVEYHYGEGRITNSSRIFTKDGQSQIVQVNPLADRPQPAALLEEFQDLLVREKDCMQAVRDSEWEVSEIARTRTNQEQNITLEMPYYDIVRIKAEESEEEEEEAQAASYDYLSPFLPTMLGMSQLTRQQALEVREKALKALKDRLIERANIIQARLDEESAALARRQQVFARDRDQMTAAEEEEYERAVEESMFRIHILEKRLRRHEEQALKKYYDLDATLRRDSRLSALLAAQLY